jgi:hypothetical protein
MASNETSKDADNAVIDNTVIIASVLEELVSMADWISTVVAPWAQGNSKIRKILMKEKPENNFHGDVVPVGVFCKLIGRIMRESTMECRHCPLFLYGYLANKDTKKLLGTGDRNTATISMMRRSEISHDGCFACQAMAINEEGMDKDATKAAKEELWKLACVISPLQLTFLFGVRNYYGRIIKEDIESGHGEELFDPANTDSRHASSMKLLFDPTPETETIKHAVEDLKENEDDNK